MLQAPVVIHSMYGSYSIAVVKAGVGVVVGFVVAAVVKAAATVVCGASCGVRVFDDGGKCCCSS